MMGKDTFVPTDPVVRSLAHWQVFDGPLKSKAAQAELQSVFNTWHAETGKPFSPKAIALGGGEQLEEKRIVPSGALDFAPRGALLLVGAEDVQRETAQSGEVFGSVVFAGA